MWAFSIVSPKSPLERPCGVCARPGPPLLSGEWLACHEQGGVLGQGAHGMRCVMRFSCSVCMRVRVFVYGVRFFAIACVFETLWIRDGFGGALSIHLIALV